MASRKSIFQHLLTQIVLVLLALSTTIAQTSQGTQLGTQAVADPRDGDCFIYDIMSTLVNDRAVACGQGQTDFFHGEQRFVYATGESVSERNLYELTSCACALGAVWTRVHKSVWSA